ncbi:MAG: four-carbon acid sugar kinase family protein [Spirochaetales bacterium]|nr:four-carbon acid sugar kinase family protein [Spirochaetales bacterium]
MSLKMCIIADDLTGAGDTGIQFKKAGSSVYLSLHPNHLVIHEDADVVVINTDSRFLEPEDAYKLVYNSVLGCRKAGVSRFYKKIDSTLRGNINREIDAILDAAGYRAAVITPSAPRNNRTVKNGCCFLNGKMIHETEAGRDFFNPVVSSYIPDHFSGEPDKTIVLNIDELHDVAMSLADRIMSLVEKGYRYIICDAESCEDLRVIAGIEALDDILLVGSSGLAEKLSEGGAENTVRPDGLNIPAEGILIINGSRTNISALQVQEALKEREVFVLDVSRKGIVTDGDGEFDRLTSEIEAGKKAVPWLVRVQSDEALKDENPDEMRRLADSISSFIGRLVGKIVYDRDIRAMVLIGGDTSYKVMDALGIEEVEYLGEVLPGIPFGKLSGGKGVEPFFISKSGGFGDENTLKKLLDFLVQEKWENNE